jgi:hypothetical protein
MVITSLTTLLTTIEIGLGVGLLASMLVLLHSITDLQTTELGRLPTLQQQAVPRFRNIESHPEARPLDHVKVRFFRLVFEPHRYRFDLVSHRVVLRCCNPEVGVLVGARSPTLRLGHSITSRSGAHGSVPLGTND